MENVLFSSSTTSESNIGPTLSQYISRQGHITEIPPISTGSKTFDELILGGIRSNCIYEISGFQNSGKMVLTLNIVNNFLLLGRRVLWIDTSAKVPLHELIRLNGFKSSLLLNDNLQYTRLDSLIQLIVLFKQLNNGELQEQNYSLIVVNEFSDLIHYSFLILEEEIMKRKKEIELLKKKFEIEKKAREAVGERYMTKEIVPLLGSSLLVRQNKLMHQILGLLGLYNERVQSATVLIGSLNTTSQKLLLETSSNSSKRENVRQLQTVYQSKLIPTLGEETPWLGLLEARILLYKDWQEDKVGIKNIQDATTLTYAILKFNRPSITKDLRHPNSRIIKTTKKIRFKADINGIEDVDGTVVPESVIGFAGTQHTNDVEFNDLNEIFNSHPEPPLDTSFDIASSPISILKRNLSPEKLQKDKRKRV